MSYNSELQNNNSLLQEILKMVNELPDAGTGANPAAQLYPALGATFPPLQVPADADFEGYDIDLLNSTADDLYAYIDTAVANKNTVTKEILGKDASGKYDIARYTYAKRDNLAWVKENYPRMYAWKSGNTVKYTESISPRINEKAYSNPYVETSGTQTETVPAKGAIVIGKRYSSSGGGFITESGVASVIIPVEIDRYYAGGDGVPLVLNGMKQHATRTAFYYGETNTTFPKTANKSTTDNINFSVFNIGYAAEDRGKQFLVLFVNSTGASGEFDGVSATFNGKTVACEVCTDSTYATHESTTTIIVEGGGTPITAVSATNRSRTIDGVEYVRYADGDVEPTLIYTDIGDSRNANASITEDGITYNRYPLGDLGSNRTKPIPIFIYANEHGVVKDTVAAENHEGKHPALIAARMLRDLAADKQENSAIYKYIRENCMLIVIPVANPFGFNFNLTDDTNGYTGYYNKNTVNINRNYDTPGWDYMKNNGTGSAMGAYAGSEIETQFIMNTMVESGAVVAMSLHGFASPNSACAHQGQNPGNVDYNQEKLSKINSFLKTNWGYSLVYYDGEPLLNTPEVTSKAPSYITQCGAYGGIVEISPDDNRTSGLKQEYNQHVCENAYAQVLNLLAMWLTDYAEANV